MVPNISPIMENQMENEMEAGIIQGLSYIIALMIISLNSPTR